MSGASDVAAWPHLHIPRGERLIVTLHGFGGNESEVSQLGSWLDADASVLSPRGPKVIHGSHYWWGTLTDEGFRPDDVEAQAEALHGFLERAVIDYGYDRKDVIIAGFSNGAAMALAIGVLYPEKYQTICAFSGWLPFGSLEGRTLEGLRVWFSHGDSDPWVSHEQSAHATSTLSRAGAGVSSLIRPGGHLIGEEEIAGAKGLLSRPAG